MNRVRILFLLLLLQLVVAVALKSRGDSLAAFVSGQPFFVGSHDQVKRITVADGEGRSLLLVRNSSSWVLPELNDFPASSRHIGELFEKLRVHRPYPIASTIAAASRLHVADNTFDRRFTFHRGEGDAVLYLGAAPTFRRVYARLGGEQEIYEIPFDLFEYPTIPDEWYDTELLKIHERSIRQVKTPSVTLLRREQGSGGYALEELPLGRQIIFTAASDFFRLIAELSFVGIVESPTDPVQDAYLVEVTLDDDTVRTYRFAPLETGNYSLEASGFDHVFEVLPTTVEALQSYTVATLTEPAEQAPSEATDSAQVQEATE
ncbi:MAG: DUF4340 domain-containing protein [Bdellovibrionales bacterium]|nr:DUF4340 domain-containing protein [Bdellovibrionales bacterium]